MKISFLNPKNKQHFSYNTSGLTAYIEQNTFPLLQASLFTADTVDYMTVMPGVKGSQQLNIMETDAYFNIQSCTWAASGPTSFTHRDITVGKIMVTEQLCVNDLEGFYLQTQLAPGSHYRSVPFEQQYAEFKTGKIAEQLETAIWQGNTSSGNGNLARFDGLLKIIDAATAVTTHATTQTSITASTVRGIFDDIYVKIPAQLLNKPDLFVFCGWDTYRTLITKLTTDNLYHINAQPDALSGKITYQGMTIVAVNGLNGTNRIIAARKSNLFFGTDLLDEQNNFELVELQDASHAFRFRADFKAGTQVAFPAEIVEYHNT